MQPAVPQGSGGGVRVVAVALHHVVSAHHQLTHVVGPAGQSLTLVVDHDDLDPPDGLADREEPTVVPGPVEGRRRARLRQPVALEQQHSVALLDRGQDVSGDRRPTRDGQPERGEVPSARVLLEHRVVHRGHAEHDGDPVPLHDLDGPPGVEALHDRDGADVPDGDADQAESVDVEERHDGEGDVVRTEAEECAGVDRVEDELEVGQLRTLGTSGGPAGVEQDSGVLRAGRHHVAERVGGVEVAQLVAAVGRLGPAHVHRDASRRAHHLEGMVAARQQDPRPRVGQQVPDLLFSQERVHRHHHQPGTHDAEVDEDEVRGVGELHRHRVTPLETKVEGDRPQAWRTRCRRRHSSRSGIRGPTGLVGLRGHGLAQDIATLRLIADPTGSSSRSPATGGSSWRAPRRCGRPSAAAP